MAVINTEADIERIEVADLATARTTAIPKQFASIKDASGNHKLYAKHGSYVSDSSDATFSADGTDASFASVTTTDLAGGGNQNIGVDNAGTLIIKADSDNQNLENVLTQGNSANGLTIEDIASLSNGTNGSVLTFNTDGTAEFDQMAISTIDGASSKSVVTKEWTLAEIDSNLTNFYVVKTQSELLTALSDMTFSDDKVIWITELTSITDSTPSIVGINRVYGAGFIFSAASTALDGVGTIYAYNDYVQIAGTPFDTLTANLYIRHLTMTGTPTVAGSITYEKVEGAYVGTIVQDFWDNTISSSGGGTLSEGDLYALNTADGAGGWVDSGLLLDSSDVTTPVIEGTRLYFDVVDGIRFNIDNDGNSAGSGNNVKVTSGDVIGGATTEIFKVEEDGVVTAEALTNALIDGHTTDRVLITKEYGDANYAGGSVPTYTTVTLIEAATGADNDLAYCVENETLYRYEAHASAYTDDNLFVLSTGDAGATRWLGVAGQYTEGTVDTNSGFMMDNVDILRSRNVGTLFVGDSGNDTQDGNFNVGVGLDSLKSLTDGDYNMALGYVALEDLTTGTSNVAMGSAALYDEIDGDSNVAVGDSALRKVTTGDNNVGIGYQSGMLINNGSDNTKSDDSIFIGYDTRPLAVSATNEIVIGDSARGNGSNTATIGNDSIIHTYLKGNVNLASGKHFNIDGSVMARTVNTTNMFLAGGGNDTVTGVNNTGIGYNSLTVIENGYSNVAVGSQALSFNTSGYSNVAVGALSLQDNITGNFNTSIGAGSLVQNTIGGLSTAIGYASLQENTIGTENTGLGHKSLVSNIDGDFNVAVGSYAGARITDASPLDDSDTSVFIGYDTRAEAESQSNQIVIGSTAIGKGSNTAVIGNSSIVHNYIQGNLNFAPRATPDTAEEGDIYYDSDTNTHYGRTDTAWVELGGGGGGSTNYSHGSITAGRYVGNASNLYIPASASTDQTNTTYGVVDRGSIIIEDGTINKYSYNFKGIAYTDDLVVKIKVNGTDADTVTLTSETIGVRTLTTPKAVVAGDQVEILLNATGASGITLDCASFNVRVDE